MYDYGNAKRYRIENVDHEIHILGIKLGYFPYLLWGFLLGLMTSGPIIAISNVLLIIFLCRYLYSKEERGEPVTFDPRLIAFFQKLPNFIRKKMLGLVPSLGSIEFPQKIYRE